jgi:hypothetical protein
MSPDAFVENAKTLVELGWHPVPLGRERGKKLLVTGVTGRSGFDVTDEDTFREWADEWATAGLNLGTRMPVGVIAIDVDCYDGKSGARTITEHEKAWGPLPATWSVTARTDGSRKLFFRVPEGWTARGVLGAGVEIVQRHHRYSVAPLSLHDEGQVRAFAPDGHDCGQLPPPDDLPELPEAWRDGLARSRTTAHEKGSAVDGDALSAQFRDGPMTADVLAALNVVLEAIAGGGGRHDSLNDALPELARLGALGRSGVAVAFRTAEEEFVQAIGDRLSESAARAEFRSSRDGALRLIAGERQRLDWRGDFFNDDGTIQSESGFGRSLLEMFGQSKFDDFRRRGIVDGTPAQSAETASRQFTQSLAGVTPTKVEWLWWPWIPSGKLTMFEGEPDVGKSTMTLTWAAMVSNGGPWPVTTVGDHQTRNEKGLCEPASVVLVGVEDDLADTVVPRLMAAGADLERVSTMARPRDERGRPVPFLIPDDVDKLKLAIEEVNAALVIIDPITAFMSDAVKPGSDTSNRKALMELADVAEQTGAAIVLVRHLNKAIGMSAKHRGGGSIAYTALARSSLLAAKLPVDEGRENTEATHGLASIKGNLAREPRALGYRLRSSPNDPDSPVVRWVGSLDESADEMVGADGAKPDARKAAPARDEAARMIKELLANGPMEAKDVRKMVSAEVGCSDKTVANAANKLLIVKVPVRDDDGTVSHWTWELPPSTFKASSSSKSGKKVAGNGQG